MEGLVIRSQSLVERSNILSPTFHLTLHICVYFNHLAYCNHGYISIHDIILTTTVDS